MTLNQFKSWLEGFMEGIPDPNSMPRRYLDRMMDKLYLELDHEPMDFGPFLHRYFTPYADIWNELGSTDRGESVTIDAAFVERLMHRNSAALWKIAGRAEYLSIARTEVDVAIE